MLLLIKLPCIIHFECAAFEWACFNTN